MRPNSGVTLIEYPGIFCKNDAPSRPASLIEHPSRNASKQLDIGKLSPGYWRIGTGHLLHFVL